MPELKQESFKNGDKMQLASKNQNFYNELLQVISNNGIYNFSN